MTTFLNDVSSLLNNDKEKTTTQKNDETCQLSLYTMYLLYVL